jgi:hypothetical protein
MSVTIIRKGQPTTAETHANDAYLANMTVAYMQELAKFGVLGVFPTVPVVKQSDFYYIFDKAALLRIDAKLRAPGTPAPRSGYTVSTDTYILARKSLAHAINDPSRSFTDAVIQPEVQAADYLATNLLMSLTADWATTHFVTGVWGTSATLTLKWNDPNSDPIADVQTATRTIAQNTGREANVGVLARLVYDRLLVHPDIVDRIKYGQTQGRPAQANAQTLAQLFGLDRVVVLNSIFNSGGEGGTSTYAFQGDTDAALFVHAAPVAGLRTPSAGYTFTKAATGNIMGAEMKVWRDEENESDVYENNVWYDFKITGSDLGYFIADAAD